MPGMGGESARWGWRWVYHHVVGTSEVVVMVFVATWRGADIVCQSCVGELAVVIRLTICTYGRGLTERHAVGYSVIVPLLPEYSCYKRYDYYGYYHYDDRDDDR